MSVANEDGRRVQNSRHKHEMTDLRAAPPIMRLPEDGRRVHPPLNCDVGHKKIKLVTRILTERIIAEEYYLL